MFRKESLVRQIAFLLLAVAIVTAVVALRTGAADAQAAPVFVTKIPSGYRDWRLISVAHEEGSLHSFAAILGNDVAIKAYREGTLPFPDGTIIAALHYRHIPSEENNKVFGQPQSFVAGPPTNVQFMVKDSKNTPRPAAGDSPILPTANLPLRRRSKAASPATRKFKSATWSSLVTHLNTN
jgi:hypothetical protein